MYSILRHWGPRDILLSSPFIYMLPLDIPLLHYSFNRTGSVATPTYMQEIISRRLIGFSWVGRCVRNGGSV